MKISYETIKKNIEKIEELSKKYGIKDENFKQDLLNLLMENDYNKEETKKETKKETNNMTKTFKDIINSMYENGIFFDDESDDIKCIVRLDEETLNKCLSKIEKQVLEMYYGLNGHEPLKIERIANSYNKSPEFIKYILDSAIYKLTIFSTEFI